MTVDECVVLVRRYRDAVAGGRSASDLEKLRDLAWQIARLRCDDRELVDEATRRVYLESKNVTETPLDTTSVGAPDLEALVAATAVREAAKYRGGW